MSVIWSLCLIFLPGFLVAASMARRSSCSRWERLVDSLAFGPLIAMAVTSLHFFYVKWFTGHFPSTTSLAGTWVILSLGAGVFYRFRKEKAVSKFVDKRSPYQQACGILALIMFLWSSTLFWIRSHVMPTGGWDGFAIWNALGRLMGRFDGDMHDKLALMPLGHPEYPHMLPGTLASAFRIAGSEPYVISQVVGYFGFVAFVFVLLRMGQRLSGATAGFILAAIACATPHFVTIAAYQYADVVLAALNTIALGSLALLLKGPSTTSASPWIAGFFLGLLPWIKNEGWMYALVALSLFLFLSVLGKSQRRGLMLRVMQIILGAMPGFAAWYLFKNNWAPPNLLTQEGAAPVIDALKEGERWRTAATFFVDELTNRSGLGFWRQHPQANRTAQNWVLFWPGLVILMLVAAVGRSVRTRRNLFLLLAVLGQFCAVFLVMVAIPKQAWHLRTAAPRLLLQISPGLLLLLGALLPQEREEKEEEKD